MPVGDLDSTDRGSGARFNDNKPALDLIPLHLLESTARVLDYGRHKYATWNWAKGMPWSVPYGCVLRHLSAWYRGETNDPESGESHLAHVMCNLLMLLAYEENYQEGDDRPKEYFRNDVQS